MQFRSIAGRARAVAAATALLASIAASGSPATAAQTGVGAFSVSTPPVAAHGVRATFSYEATPFLGWTLVEFDCKVTAWVDPASTGVDECSLDGTDGLTSPNNVPGAVAADTGVAWIPDGTEPLACVQGSASFLEDKLGPREVSTDRKCEPLTLLELNVDGTR